VDSAAAALRDCASRGFIYRRSEKGRRNVLPFSLLLFAVVAFGFLVIGGLGRASNLSHMCAGYMLDRHSPSAYIDASQ
jgi:hypothetical protein